MFRFEVRRVGSWGSAILENVGNAIPVRVSSQTTARAGLLYRCCPTGEGAATGTEPVPRPAGERNPLKAPAV